VFLHAIQTTKRGLALLETRGPFLPKTVRTLALERERERDKRPETLRIMSRKKRQMETEPEKKTINTLISGIVSWE
jgi:hypothetical protein